MVQAGLRRRGLFVRRPSFLDRARGVRQVVFDKTGTLTSATLSLDNPEALGLLEAGVRRVLANLVGRSAHPKSEAIRRALDAYAVPLDPSVEVTEHPGQGLELDDGVRVWRLGEPAWAAPAAPLDATHDVALGCDGRRIAGFATSERLRADARSEVEKLERAGYEVWLLSGDAQVRADATGVACGIAPARRIGGQSPKDKASFVAAPEHRSAVFIGDGVNDALAIDGALCSGTPAVDRPFVPARADFFFLTPGLNLVRVALQSSRVLAQVVRADLAVALAYNALTLGLALSGRMSPLVCAVLMPTSSLSTIAATVIALAPGRSFWKS
jgi:Cu2+-exporting ATPase